MTSYLGRHTVTSERHKTSYPQGNREAIVLELAIVVILIGIFDLAAIRWGVDSRGR
ncbi:MAG: hypothetical protein ACRDHD_03735 [Candidatus Limnocylindria bacterium]